MNKNYPILTEFDRITLGNSTQLIKAILPFLDFNTQKMLAIFVRIQELKATINFYSSNESSVFAKRAKNGFDQNDLKDMIKEYFPDINLDMIDNLNNFMQMENMMSAFQNMTNAPDGKKDTDKSHDQEGDNSDNGFSFMENMMNPEQKQTYENLLKTLENMDLESEDDI